jgi:Arc/MetJ-type ribon-helix-helix transcriptional regulator
LGRPLFSSLALNLLFFGVAVAMAARTSTHLPWNRDIFIYVERLLVTMPQPDAVVMRTQIESDRYEIKNAQSAYRAAQEAIREALRQDPFDVGKMHAAMVETREARQDFDRAVQEIFASAAEHMSPIGRRVLAEETAGP